MTVTVYQSTDASAPVLNGSAGSLIALLDACLVNGYGAKAAAGWTKAFSGTNLASYRAPSGNRFYLGIDDSTTLNARARGFETMTAAGVSVASGSGPFPTDVQLSGGNYIYKGADTGTARVWRLVSDGQTLHLSINVATYFALFSFGDFASYKTADAYNTVIMGEVNANAHTAALIAYTSYSSAQSGAFLTRPHTQLGGAATSCKTVDAAYGVSNNQQIGSSGLSYPSPIEGALLLSRVQIGEPGSGVRGLLPGLWCPMHTRPLADGDTFSGTGDLSGRTFMAWIVGNTGQVFIETSDTWGA